ncbi:unnamed protein product [Prunus armeniaca]
MSGITFFLFQSFPEGHLVYFHAVVWVLARASGIHELVKNSMRICILRGPTGRAKLFTRFVFTPMMEGQSSPLP